MIWVVHYPSNWGATGPHQEKIKGLGPPYYFLCKYLILQPAELKQPTATVCQSHVACFSEIQTCQEQHKDSDTISFISSVYLTCPKISNLSCKSSLVGDQWCFVTWSLPLKHIVYEQNSEGIHTLFEILFLCLLRTKQELWPLLVCKYKCFLWGSNL